jgi:hypothetical protein
MDSVDLLKLPPELLFQVLNSLDSQSLCRLSATNKSFRNILDRMEIWRHFCLKHWGLEASGKFSHIPTTSLIVFVDTDFFSVLEIGSTKVNWKREFRFLHYIMKKVYGNQLVIYPEDAAFVRFIDDKCLKFEFYEASDKLKAEAIVSSLFVFCSSYKQTLNITTHTHIHTPQFVLLCFFDIFNNVKGTAIKV